MKNGYTILGTVGMVFVSLDRGIAKHTRERSKGMVLPDGIRPSV
jgi:hypothetical protein